MTIHIKASPHTDDKILFELMNILIKHGYETEKYLGSSSKIIMAKKEKKNLSGKEVIKK